MATERQTMETAPARTPRQKQLVLFFSRVWAWVFLVGLIAFFAISVGIQSRGGVNFLTIRNSQNILMAIVPVFLMGLGQTFVVIAAGIDLSVGWVMGLASVVSALAIVALIETGMPEASAVALGSVAGILAAMVPGMINGVIIAKLRIPSFIVTLGMSFIARGVAFLLSGGNVVGGQPQGVRNLGNEALLYLISGQNGGLYFLQPPPVTGEALRQMDRILQWPVVITFVIGWSRFLFSVKRNLAGMCMPSEETAKRRCAPEFPWTGTSLCFTHSRRLPPGWPAF